MIVVVSRSMARELKNDSYALHGYALGPVSWHFTRQSIIALPSRENATENK